MKEWVSDPNAGNIFITNYPKLQNTLAPLISLIFDLTGRHILSLPDNLERRTFVVLDEIGQLQRIPSIITLLTEGRSKGFCGIIGIQDLGQLDTIYSREQKDTLVNACNTRVILAASGNTANELERIINDTEVEETNFTFSMGVRDNRDGLSINKSKVKKPLVLASEISALPALQCYIQFPDTPYTKTNLSWKSYGSSSVPLIVRNGLSFEELLKNELVSTNPFINSDPIINPISKENLTPENNFNLEEEVVNIGGDDEWLEN